MSIHDHKNLPAAFRERAAFREGGPQPKSKARRVTRNTPLGLIPLIDDSGSMHESGAHRQVTEAMQGLVRSLAQTNKDKKAWIFSSIVSFGSRARAMPDHLAELKHFQASKLNFEGTSGQTNLAAGLDRARALIVDAMPGKDWHSFLVLVLTDGEPQLDGDPNAVENALVAARALKELETENTEVVVAALGYGSARQDVLDEIATSRDHVLIVPAVEQIVALLPNIGTPVIGDSASMSEHVANQFKAVRAKTSTRPKSDP